MRALGVVAVMLMFAPACGENRGAATQTAAAAAATAAATPTPAVFVPSGTPPPWAGPDQVAQQLPLVRDSPVPVRETHAERRDFRLPPSLSGARLITAGGRNLYFDTARSVTAVDAVRGIVRWTVDGVSTAGAAASDTLLFVTTQVTTATQPMNAVALSAVDGHRVVTRPGSWFGNVLHGYFYSSFSTGTGTQSFAAFDAATAKEIWRTSGFWSVGGKPALIGNTLLQSFAESGAITLNAMHAFDVSSGRELWRNGYGPRPLGTAPGVVYLDTTWFPLQLDNYVPLGIGTVDITSGKMRHEYYYKPDRARNWRAPGVTDSRGSNAHVGGGFVTFRVNGAWYRYDADRDPNDAHATRLDGIDDIAAFVGDARALVSTNGSAAIAHLLPDRVVLQPLASGVPRSPVAESDGGTQYVVVGDRMLAFDRGVSSVRSLGTVPRCSVIDVIALRASVAVRCQSEDAAAGDRVIDFADTPAPAVAVAAAHPQPPAAPHFAVSVTRAPVPPAGPTSADRQWWPTSIAAAHNGSLAIVLTPGSSNRGGAVGRVAPNGSVTLVPLPTGIEPPRPHDAVVDAHGTIWFNDQRVATVTSLDTNGTLTSHLVGASPEPVPSAAPSGRNAFRRLPRFTLGIRLAIGPDGEAWYARSHPTRAIGRVDGTRTFAVPESFGDVFDLKGGRDGALWFLTADEVGRVALDGTFARVEVPADFTRRGYPGARLVAAPGGTMWIANGRHVAEIGSHGVLRAWSLANASSYITALTVGCDGAVYVADGLGTQIGRLLPDGSVEEHESGLYSIDGLATASDCRIWYVGGSNAPEQYVGVVRFLPSRP